MPRWPEGMTVLERGWLSANNILFKGSAGATLIDSGYCTHAEQTLSLVKHALANDPLDRLVSTHLHSDHCGGNAHLQAAYPSITTAVPAGEFEAARRWDTRQLSYDATGQCCPRFRVDIALSDGARLELGDAEWQVRAAPGHDPHSIILHCPRYRLLISADALWENGFGVIFPEIDGPGAFQDVEDTLKLIESLAIETVVPGHGAPFGDVPAAIERARQRLIYLRADPTRNAKNALKVLLKFKLLDVGRIELDELPAWLRSVPLVRRANERFFQLGDESLATWLADELVKAQAARIDGGLLLNA